jgi:hypothetical protein
MFKNYSNKYFSLSLVELSELRPIRFRKYIFRIYRHNYSHFLKVLIKSYLRILCKYLNVETWRYSKCHVTSNKANSNLECAEDKFQTRGWVQGCEK